MLVPFVTPRAGRRHSISFSSISLRRKRKYILNNHLNSASSQTQTALLWTPKKTVYIVGITMMFLSATSLSHCYNYYSPLLYCCPTSLYSAVSIMRTWQKYRTLFGKNILHIKLESWFALYIMVEEKTKIRSYIYIRAQKLTQVASTIHTVKSLLISTFGVHE